MRGVSGALGLADNIVTLRDQAALPATERVVVLRARPTVVVPGPWTVHSGNAYKAPFVFGIDNCGLDVVAVYTSASPRDSLTRVESIAACIAASSSFYYDLGETVPVNLTSWDAASFRLPVNRKRASLPNAWRQPSDPLSDLGLEWDAGDSYDGQPTLYVNVGGGSPADVLTSVAVEFVFGTRGIVHASLGDDALSPDGRFETWTAGAPSGFTATGNVFQGTDTYEGSSSLELRCATAATVLQARARHTNGLATTAGAYYKVFGYYQTDQANPSGVEAAIAVRDGQHGASFFVQDGRHRTSTGSGVALTNTFGEWRHFTFEFRAVGSVTGLDFMCLDGPASHTTGVVRFDRVQFRRVWRHTRALGRIVGDITISSNQESRGFGGKSVGVSNIALSNEDGALDVAFRALTWAGAQFSVEMLGRFGGNPPTQREKIGALRDFNDPRANIGSTDGAGSPLSDGRTLSTGYVNDCRRSDAALSVSGEDLRTLIYGKRAVPNKYQTDAFPDADKRIFERGRPVVIGEVTEHAPNRIGKTATEECGIYEVADCSSVVAGIASSGIKDITSVMLYADSDAASRRDATLQLELLSIDSVITKDLANGKFTAETALVPFVLDTEHEYYSFKVNGVQYDARVMAGTESQELLPATGAGTDTAFGGASGAPTPWQAVLSADDGSYAFMSSANPTIDQYFDVAATALPSVTSVAHVELRATVEQGTFGPFEPYEEGATSYAALYVKIAGVRYEAPPGSDGYVANPYFVPGEDHRLSLSYVWGQSPATSTAWTEAEVNGATFGVHYHFAAGFYVGGSQLRIDFLRPEARVFLASPPSASNPGICIPLTLAQRLQAEMNRQLAADKFAVAYDDTTRKLSITYTGVPTDVAELLLSTGKQKSGWGWIGYSTTADVSQTILPFGTTLTFDADNVIYTPAADIDKGSILCAVSGYKDDTSGTFTGAPGALIERPGDVLYYALVRLFTFPSALIDLTTFEAARATTTMPLALVFADERTVKDFVDTIEQESLSDVVFVPGSISALASVQVEFRPFAFGADGDEPEVLDGDWLSFESNQSRSKYYGQVDITFLRSLLLKGVRTTTVPLVQILSKQDAPLEIETDLRLTGDAQACADAQAALYSGRFEFQGEARGKLLLLTASDKFLVSRRRGGYSRAPFRAMTLTHNLRSGTTQVTAIDVAETS